MTTRATPAEILLQEASAAEDRVDLWVRVVNRLGLTSIAEIGVFKGEFAERLLRECPRLERYVMIDPWAHLDEWNKPFNLSDRALRRAGREAMARTEFAASRRVVHRACTQDAVAQGALQGVQAVYIDGDHTLRGILLDLLSVFDAGEQVEWIFGDDFMPTIWQHDRRFEPTLVFPVAVHVAEAKRLPIFALPFEQFAIHRAADAPGFAFTDLVGTYGDRSLASQLAGRDGFVSATLRQAARRAAAALRRSSSP